MKEHKGMGFSAAVKNIQNKEGYSKGQASAILASSTRKAAKNPKTLAKNPNLAKVAQKKKK